MKKQLIKLLATTSLLVITGVANAAAETAHQASDETIAEQRMILAKSSDGAGIGPQSPRDIDAVDGNNPISFEPAPAYTEMNLCDIHFHENAEHKGGEFTKYAGNGDGLGNGTGYKYNGKLSADELADVGMKIGLTKHGDLIPGDTIEAHYVHSTADVKPGPTLASCLSDTAVNLKLRVETQVYVLVNDDSALDFVNLSKIESRNGVFQAINIPVNTGAPIQYAGSTTGPTYNEKGSPYKVSWSVRPKVAKVNIKTVDNWLKKNVFNENHAHGVRNLVVNPDLLSHIAN